MKQNQIITIGRQFGAGGRSVGKKLADQLGIGFYDKELIAEASKASGLPQQLLRYMDEQHTASLLYSLVMNLQNQNPFGSGKTVELMAYEAQISAVKYVAAKGPCVIVGRAADRILESDYDVISFFIVSPMEKRIHHIIERDGISREEAVSKIARLDKSRASFYNYFSDKKWGAAGSYDLCINAGSIGEDTALHLMLQCISER